MTELQARFEGTKTYATEVLNLTEREAQRYAEQDQAAYLLHVIETVAGPALIQQARETGEKLLAGGYTFPLGQ